MVSEGEEILIGKLTDPKIVEADVLLFVDEDKVEVGKPTLKVPLKLKVVSDLVKGKKVEVYKFKAKSRYRKHTGFRPKYSKILVEQIG